MLGTRPIGRSAASVNIVTSLDGRVVYSTWTNGRPVDSSINSRHPCNMVQIVQRHGSALKSCSCLKL